MPPRNQSPGEGCTSRARKRRYGNIVPDTRQCFDAGLEPLSGLAYRISRCVAGDFRNVNVTIYHNPMCGTSRKTLDILRENGDEPKVVEYLKTPPNRDELRRLYERAGISPREGLRAREPLAAELGLTRSDVSDDEILDAMVEHPILIERPLVETDKGVRLCRPQEVVREIL